jgi:hypothetical protein
MIQRNILWDRQGLGVNGWGGFIENNVSQMRRKSRWSTRKKKKKEEERRRKEIKIDKNSLRGKKRL